MKRIMIVMLALILCLSLFVPAMAQSTPHLVDEADLLSDVEEAQILSMLDAISNRQGMDVVLVTADTLDGKSPQEYADDFYDYNGYSQDGILLLISMEDSDWWISTSGYGITAFTDAGIDRMGELFVPSLSAGDYGEAFEIYADTCDEFITQAKVGDPYDIHNLPKEPFSFFRSLLICLVIVFVFALIVTGIMRGKLKTVRFQSGAANYVKSGSLNVTHRQDLFLYRDVKRTPRPKDNGGSRTHMSSSGRSHGGGGGKF